MNSDELTHFNNRGEAHMVDVGAKPHSKRIAIATGIISVNETAFNKIRNGDSKKGMCSVLHELPQYRHLNKPVI